MSSAKSRSSSFDVKFHLIPVLIPAVVFLVIKSTTIKKINPDITSPCLTPVLTFNLHDLDTLGALSQSFFKVHKYDV